MSRPSPSLVISIIALVVATAGTATAAGVLITNSSQVKAGSLSGSDIHAKSLTNRVFANGAVDGRVLKKGTITSNQLSGDVRTAISGGLSATEAVRKDGPTAQNGGQATVVVMPNVPPGAYAIFAKMTMSPEVDNLGLGELLRNPRTGGGHCVLNAAGDQDDARAPILTPYSQTPATMNVQMTRTLGTQSNIALQCDANIGWKATDASIIAIKLSGANRIDSAAAADTVVPPPGG